MHLLTKRESLAEDKGKERGEIRPRCPSIFLEKTFPVYEYIKSKQSGAQFLS